MKAIKSFEAEPEKLERNGVGGKISIQIEKQKHTTTAQEADPGLDFGMTLVHVFFLLRSFFKFYTLRSQQNTSSGRQLNNATKSP